MSRWCLLLRNLCIQILIYIFVIWFHDFPTFWAHSKSCIYVPLAWNIWDVDWMLWTLRIAPQRRPPRPGPWRGQHKAERAHCLPRQRTDRYTLTRKHVEFHRMKGWIGASAFFNPCSKTQTSNDGERKPTGNEQFQLLRSWCVFFTYQYVKCTCACELVIQSNPFNLRHDLDKQLDHLLENGVCPIKSTAPFEYPALRHSDAGEFCAMKSQRCNLGSERSQVSHDSWLQSSETNRSLKRRWPSVHWNIQTLPIVQSFSNVELLSPVYDIGKEHF